MTREEYERMSAAQLKEAAKEKGIKGVSALRKSEVIDVLMAHEPARNAAEPKDSSQPSGRKRRARAEETSAKETPAKETAVKEPAAKEAPAKETSAKEAAPAPGASSQEQAERRSQMPRRAPQTRRTDSVQRGSARGEMRAKGTERRNAPDKTEAAQGAKASAPQGRMPRQMSASPNRQGSAHPAVAQGDQAPMTRGELRQSNPQPRNPERPESLQERMEADRPPMELKQLDSGNTVSGVLEVMSDGYGFIRSNNYLPGEDDIYVSPSQIRRFNLKTGDIICGNTRVHSQQEKFSALLFVRTINGYVPSEAQKRYNFEEMTPVFPNERLRMERTGREIAMRIVDILSPIGKGQRGLIVSPPKAGKTTLLKDIARSIQRNNPEMHIIIMLIDERPEEVTDIREAIVGENVEVLDSTFDETPEHHKRVAEMGIERAKRLVEHRRDVVILLDSITRLARAYNLIVPPSGRTLSGGLDPAALHPPKRFFGAARNMREGGSLTILATALVDTGSKMDDVVYEEFKGTGNMELILDRKLSERRVFPAIDIMKSGTRREDLLLTTDEGEASYVMRRAMNGMKGEDAVERILDMFARTRSNEELVQRIKHSHVI